MSKLQKFKDLSEHDQKLINEGLKKAALKMASDDLNFFSALGLTPEQIKAGAEAFMALNAAKLNDQKYVLYKSPIGRRMFIAGYNQSKGTQQWSSYTTKK